MILTINRNKPFNPALFEDGRSIWRGAADGSGLEGEEQQDARSLALQEVDFTKARFETCLAEGEKMIGGEKRLSCLQEMDVIRADAKIGQALYEEPDQKTLEWLYQTFGITGFGLPGTTLQDPKGLRYFLALYRKAPDFEFYGGNDNWWYWHQCLLFYDCRAGDPALVFASSELGEQNARRLLKGEVEITFQEIVRRLATTPFNITEFIGEGWKVWRGPASGNGLEGEADVDLRGEELKEIEWLKVLFETCLNTGEGSIKGEEKLCLLKQIPNIRLGGNVFLSLWKDYQENGKDSVLERLYRIEQIRYVDFMGLILRSPNGSRYVLYLCRRADGTWFWDCRWLGRDWSVQPFSASLAS